MKRAICVWLPNWPLQRLWVARPELRPRPVVLYDETSRSGCVVAACSKPAVERGVRPGMSLAEATALLETSPGAARSTATSAAPLFERHDPRADLSALQALADWCQQFTPFVGLEDAPEIESRPESLLLDITGCERVFHGEDNLARQVVREFQRRGFQVRVAVADTLGAAWAAAHFATPGSMTSNNAARSASSGSTVRGSAPRSTAPNRSPAVSLDHLQIIPPGQTATLLQPLPLTALRLAPETVRLFHDLGICRIGQLLALPRSSLPARFGPQVLQRLDQALGRLPEVLKPCRRPPPVQAEWSFDEPAGQRRAIEAALRHLITQILDELRPAERGVQQLVCRFDTVPRHLDTTSSDDTNATSGTSAPLRLSVRLLQPSVSVRHLLELLTMQLDQRPRIDPVITIRLRAVLIAPLNVRQTALFSGGNSRAAHRTDRPAEAQQETHSQQLAALVDRLTSRLGRRAVLAPTLSPEAQPEYAGRYEPLVDAPPALRTKQRRRTAREPQPAQRTPRSKRATAHTRQKSAPSVGHSPAAPLPRGPRPLRLFPHPIRIDMLATTPAGAPLRLWWQGRDTPIAQAWGPERIETGWWRSHPARRDYFRVETATGQQLWLFRRLVEGDWYIHGEFE